MMKRAFDLIVVLLAAPVWAIGVLLMELLVLVRS